MEVDSTEVGMIECLSGYRVNSTSAGICEERRLLYISESSLASRVNHYVSRQLLRDNERLTSAQVLEGDLDGFRELKFFTVKSDPAK